MWIRISAKYEYKEWMAVAYGIQRILRIELSLKSGFYLPETRKVIDCTRCSHGPYGTVSRIKSSIEVIQKSMAISRGNMHLHQVAAGITKHTN
jgi:hypothetical protein